MCGRFTLAATGELIAAQFGLSETPQLRARYNIAPTQPVAIIREAEGRRVLEMARWGLIPAWARDASLGARLINARAETAAEKPAFRAALRQRRCLIPADGFYEWQIHPTGKQPFYVRLREGGVFAMAGLWESWRDPDGSWVQTCTILTTPANALLQPVHDRMPAILSPQHYALWLDPTLHDSTTLRRLLTPYPAESMIVYPVGRAVNTVRNDGPELIRPLS